MAVTHPPHRSLRAELTHKAPTSGTDTEGPVHHSGTLIVNERNQIVRDFNYGPVAIDGQRRHGTWPQHDIGKELNKSNYYQQNRIVTPPAGMTDDEFASKVTASAEDFSKYLIDNEVGFNINSSGSAFNCNESTTSVINNAGGTVPKPPEPLSNWGDSITRPFYNPNHGFPKKYE
ncbi:hypothetical protein BH11CYA1_BH11CYA1_16530 [soil metagenome]